MESNEKTYIFSEKALDSYVKTVQKIARLEERAACAELAKKTVCDTHIPTGVKIYGSEVAKAIQARGEA